MFRALVDDGDHVTSRVGFLGLIDMVVESEGGLRLNVTGTDIKARGAGPMTCAASGYLSGSVECQRRSGSNVSLTPKASSRT